MRASTGEPHVPRSRIDIERVPPNRNRDPPRRDADITIRMIAPTQKALTVHKLEKLSGILFAHRRYLRSLHNAQ